MTETIDYFYNINKEKEIKKIQCDNFYFLMVTNNSILDSILFFFENEKLKNPLIKVVTNNRNLIKDLSDNIDKSKIYIEGFNPNFNIESDIIFFEKLIFLNNIKFVEELEYTKDMEKFLFWFLNNNNDYLDLIDVKKINDKNFYETFLQEDMERIKNIFMYENIEKSIKEIKINYKNYIEYIIKKYKDQLEVELLQFINKMYGISLIKNNNLEESYWYLLSDINNESRKKILEKILDINEKSMNDIKFNLCLTEKIEKKSINGLFRIKSDYIKWFKSLSKEEIMDNVINNNLVLNNCMLLSGYLENKLIKKELFLNLVEKNKEIHLYLYKVKNQEEIYEWSKDIVSNKIKVGYIFNSDIVVRDPTLKLEDIRNYLSGFVSINIKDTFLYCEKIYNLNIDFEEKIKIINDIFKENKEKAINYIKEKKSFEDNLKNF